LLHNDDVEWADQMEVWKEKNAKAGDKKEKSKAGDDRTPAHRWIGYLYRSNDGVIVMPTDNILSAVKEGAASVLVPGAKNNKTFKSQSQSGLIPDGTGWPILIDGKPIPSKPIADLLLVKDFQRHKERARELGFALFVKRAKVGQKKHVRVRPRFETWSVIGNLTVVDDQITEEVLTDFFAVAGQYKGIGDWRPSAKSPGSYGTFDAEVTAVE
jgi:hypothetical protein